MSKLISPNFPYSSINDNIISKPLPSKKDKVTKLNNDKIFSPKKLIPKSSVIKTLNSSNKNGSLENKNSFPLTHITTQTEETENQKNLLKNSKDRIKIKNSINSNFDKLTSTTTSSQNSTESFKNNFMLFNDFDSNEMYYRLNRNESKNFFNKFNSRKSSDSINTNSNLSTNENTVILTIKIKTGKNDYKIFNLKKYDDLFLSLEKFFEINKINQEYFKPVLTKIFSALNKTFYLLNNKICEKDQKYLLSLYKLYMKNKNNKKINERKSFSKKEKSFSNSSSDSNDLEKRKNKFKIKRIKSENNINNNSNNSSTNDKIFKKKGKTI